MSGVEKSPAVKNNSTVYLLSYSLPRDLSTTLEMTEAKYRSVWFYKVIS